jgi:Type I phosphodiesterase / nucleotide pyrophosphatase
MLMTHRTATGPKIRPILVIGVSGATWGVLSQLKARGRTPNLARLLRRGTGASLASVKATGDEHYRPQTAWPSLATGLHPDRHGVTRFFHEASELRAPTLWRIYAECGLVSGIYGWPGTWPPPEIPGFVVPSHLARDTRTWPTDLGDLKSLDREQQSLERDGSGLERLRGAFSAGAILVRRGLRPRTFGELALAAPEVFLGDSDRRRLLLRRMKLQISRDMFLALYRRTRPDLAAFVTFYVDFVSHRYWRYRDPLGDHAREAGSYADAVDGAYETFDGVVGDLVAATGPDSIVAVVSEHGMDPEPISAEVGDHYYSIRGSRVAELAALDPAIRAHPVARWVAFRPVSATTSPRVADRLRKILVAETGLPLFRVYEHGDEVVIKFLLDRGVPRYARGNLSELKIQVGESVVPFSAIAKQAGPTRSAMHARDGILIMAGPSIRRNYWAGEASILDFAPTLLAATEVKPTVGFDGRAIDLFD